MKFSGIALALFTVAADVQNEPYLFGEAFQHASFASRLNRNIASSRTITSCHSHEPHQQPRAGLGNFAEEQHRGENDIGRKLQQMGAGTIAATAISFAAASSDPSQLPFTVVNAADLTLSKGAVVIELATPTTTSGGESTSLKKSQLKKFDASQEQKLLQTLLKNRKELGASVGRIQQSIQNELQVKESNTGPTAAPIWTEIYQELLSIEGDVVPKLQVTPPADIATTLKDLRGGKLNLLVNGEIINISVEPTFGKDEDDLIIRVKGFKGGMVPKVTEAPPPSAYYGPIRSWLSQYRDFWSFWDSPTSLFVAEGPAFLSSITNGEVVITGAISAVVLSYVAAYSYYVQQNEAEEAEAASKKAAIAEKAKQKKKKASAVEATSKKAAVAKKVEQKKKEASAVDSEDAESSTETVTTTTEKSKRRHRIRFWKNR